MSWLGIAVALTMVAGCESAATGPAPAPAPAVARVAPDAAPAIEGPAWIARRLDGGVLPSPQVLETFTLRRAGTRACLTMDVQHAETSRGFRVVGAWKPASTIEYRGTATESGTTVALDLAHDATALHLTCMPARERVAAATAIRVRHAYARYKECGDPGRWEPAATTTVEILKCELPEGFQEPHGWSIPYLAFAPSPGIEWLHVNDDCSMQGGGFRRIAADGAIAGFRAPSDR